MVEHDERFYIRHDREFWIVYTRETHDPQCRLK